MPAGYRLVALIAVFTSGCAVTGKLLTLADIESAGFDKDQRTYYQFVGAVDGSSGTWENEAVEIYQFESAGDAQVEIFDAMAQEGNAPGWTEVCAHKNIVVVSVGNKACEKLISM